MTKPQITETRFVMTSVFKISHPTTKYSFVPTTTYKFVSKQDSHGVTTDHQTEVIQEPLAKPR